MTVCIRMLVYIGIVLVSVWSSGETFILDGSSQCVVAPPCTCINSVINCNSKGLVTIPTILPFSHTSLSMLSIYMAINKISHISANAFRNVTSASIDLHLDNNNITTISDQAFNGIENSTTYLNLANNKLTSLPSAIGHLVNLQYLDVRNNPLQTLDGQVLARIYRHLQTLFISFGNMMSWPREIHVLRELQWLDIDQIHLQSLPVDAFHGFETSLQTLSLNQTDLQRIPESICNLKQLRSFTFSFNRMFNSNISLHNLCHDPLTTVTDLILQSDNIHTFPEGLFVTFPNVTLLVLDKNNLRYIPSESVPLNNRVMVLFLSNNHLSRVPSTIYRFQGLQRLYLSGNQINYIGHCDLAGLFHLVGLNIDLNPLEYIEPTTFAKQQTTLTDLNLDSTHLDTIPSAVTSLSRLKHLYFNTIPMIECSCDNLSHLRSWNVTGVSIGGSCELTHESIKYSILTSLPHCSVK